MRKTSARAIAMAFASFVLAGSAAVALPGVAAADEGLLGGGLVDAPLVSGQQEETTATEPAAEPVRSAVKRAVNLVAAPATVEPREVRPAVEPTVAGSCDATLTSADGDPITVDAGAAAGEPGVLDIGLSSASKGTGGADDPTVVNVPVEDALELVGAKDAPVVSEAAADGCDTVALTLNSTSATTQSILPGRATQQPGTQPGTDPSEPGDNGDNTDDQDPGETGSGSVDGFTGGAAAPGIQPIGYAFPMASPLPDLQLPPITQLGPPAKGPDLGLDPKTNRDADRNEGLAEAMPVSQGNSTRLPYTLAVVTLAVVAATMVRRWMTRSS